MVRGKKLIETTFTPDAALSLSANLANSFSAAPAKLSQVPIVTSRQLEVLVPTEVLSL